MLLFLNYFFWSIIFFKFPRVFKVKIFFFVLCVENNQQGIKGNHSKLCNKQTQKKSSVVFFVGFCAKKIQVLVELHYIKGSRDLFVDVGVVNNKNNNNKKKVKEKRKKRNNVTTFSRVLTVKILDVYVCVCLNVKVNKKNRKFVFKKLIQRIRKLLNQEQDANNGNVIFLRSN